MQDRFKFRGKRLDNNEWYYGSYLYLHNAYKYDWTGNKTKTEEDVHFIIDENDVNYAINPETLGQCTGLKDNNGKLIFELDHIKYKKETYKVDINKFLGITLTNILSRDIIIMDDLILFNCEVISNEFECNTKI